MLYDPKWTKPSMEHFVSWLELQPADKFYNWRSCHECACSQYAEFIGDKSWLSRNYFNGPAFWTQVNRLALGGGKQQWTFGRLLEDVRKHMKEHADA